MAILVARKKTEYINPLIKEQFIAEVFKMSKISKGSLITLSMLLAISLSSSTSNAQEIPKSQLSHPEEKNKQVERLENRLKQLEPPEPITIVDPPEQVEAEKYYPLDTISISEVINKGTKIPFRMIKNEPDYKRPVYEKHWHSTYWGGRWSYIPMRMNYALHHFFTTYDIGLSNEFDFQQNVGIVFPTFQNKTDLDMYIIAFQTTVTDVYTKGNQVVVLGNPKRNGVQVLTIKTDDLHPYDLKRLLLIQLATPLGHELDYSLISYAPPDFWLKQIQKAKGQAR